MIRNQGSSGIEILLFHITVTHILGAGHYHSSAISLQLFLKQKSQLKIDGFSSLPETPTAPGSLPPWPASTAMMRPIKGCEEAAVATRCLPKQKQKIMMQSTKRKAPERSKRLVWKERMKNKTAPSPVFSSILCCQWKQNHRHHICFWQEKVWNYFCIFYPGTLRNICYPFDSFFTTRQ